MSRGFKNAVEIMVEKRGMPMIKYLFIEHRDGPRWKRRKKSRCNNKVLTKGRISYHRIFDKLNNFKSYDKLFNS